MKCRITEPNRRIEPHEVMLGVVVAEAEKAECCQRIHIAMSYDTVNQARSRPPMPTNPPSAENVIGGVKPTLEGALKRLEDALRKSKERLGEMKIEAVVTALNEIRDELKRDAPDARPCKEVNIDGHCAHFSQKQKGKDE